MARTKERNVKIELIRIVACFLIIVEHIMLVPTDNGAGKLYVGRIVLVALTYMAVPLFALISGYLMFQNLGQNDDKGLWQSYRHKLKNFLVYVFIPSCVVVLVSGFVGPYFKGEVTLEQLFAEGNLNLYCVQNYILQQQTISVYENYNHLWYIWTYMKIVLAFPLLAGVCQDTKDKNSIRRFLILLSGLNFLYVDIQLGLAKGIGDFNSITFDRYFLCVLLGYELYLFIQKTDMKKIRVWGTALFAGSTVAGVLVEYISFTLHGLKFIPVVSTLAGSVGAFLMLYSFGTPKHTGVWNYVGKLTLYIYMLHILVLACCRRLWGDLSVELFSDNGTVLGVIIYDILYGTVIFMLSLGGGAVFRLVYENGIVASLGELWNRRMKKRKESHE